MRRILVTTVGSRGDIQPFLALSLALRDAGYAVTLAAPETFREWVEGYGIAFAPIRADVRAMLETGAGREMMQGGTNPITFFRRFKVLCMSLVDDWGQDVLRAAEGAELIVHSYVSWAPAQGVARRMGIPAINVHLQPLVPSRQFPAPFFPWRHDLPHWFHALTWQLFELGMWQFIRGPINDMRARQYGSPPLGMAGPNRRGGPLEYTTLHAYSPCIVPKPADWGEFHHVTGYWVLPQGAAWHPDPALERFLEGPKPVYIGFGSMTVASPPDELRMLGEAVKAAGVRAVIGAGWSGIGQADAPENCHVLAEAPHEWLFPRMAGVIHHGGAGTTAAALRAGVPQMVCPFIADQPFWGHRLQMIGVGPAHILHRKLTAEALAKRLGELVGTERYRRRAEEIGLRVRAEHGLKAALQLIEDSFKKPPQAAASAAG